MVKKKDVSKEMVRLQRAAQGKRQDQVQNDEEWGVELIRTREVIRRKRKPKE